MMPITIRPATPADANECGRILYAAFATLAEHHNFPRDFPSVEVATEIASLLTGHPRFFGLVAEQNGRILGGRRPLGVMVSRCVSPVLTIPGRLASGGRRRAVRPRAPVGPMS